MKHLTLLRHAKSSWQDPALDDFDRPLNGRGKRNARLMGQRLALRDEIPEVIISSPAKRARRTAELVAEALHFQEAIRFELRMYDADAGTLVELVSQLDNAWQDVLLVGHNPGLTELANLLAPCKLDNIVTCGVARFVFETDSWQEVRFNSGRLLSYDFPKKDL